MRSSHGSAVPTVPSKERQTKHYGLAEANTSVFLQHVPLLKFFFRTTTQSPDSQLSELVIKSHLTTTRPEEKHVRQNEYL